MKKLTILLAFLLSFTLMLTACSSTDSDVPQELLDTAEEDAGANDNPDTDEPEDEGPGEGTLVMATEAGFKPYEYYEGSEIVGVDVDIAREVAKELGMELLVEDMAFDSIIPAVNSGKADFGAAGLSITEERAEQVDFTIEYATSKQVILTMEDSDVMTPDDLDGKTVGVQLGTVADYELSDNYPDVALQQYNKYFEAVNDLMAGRLDAIVVDVLTAEELLQTGEGMIIREQELFTDVYAFCVAKGNTQLLDTINAVMERLIAEGKIEEFTTNHSVN